MADPSVVKDIALTVTNCLTASISLFTFILLLYKERKYKKEKANDLIYKGKNDWYKTYELQERTFSTIKLLKILENDFAIFCSNKDSEKLQESFSTFIASFYDFRALILFLTELFEKPSREAIFKVFVKIEDEVSEHLNYVLECEKDLKRDDIENMFKQHYFDVMDVTIRLSTGNHPYDACAEKNKKCFRIKGLKNEIK